MIYKCRHCAAELPEANSVCAKCGYDNGANITLAKSSAAESGQNDAFHPDSYEIELDPSDSLEDILTKVRRGAELHPDDESYHCCIGEILNDLGRYEEAAEAMRRAIELSPNDDYFHYRLGTFLQELGRYEEAEVEERKTVELNPYENSYHAALGETLQELGFYEEALKEKQRAFELACSLGVVETRLSRNEEEWRKKHDLYNKNLPDDDHWSFENLPQSYLALDGEDNNNISLFSSKMLGERIERILQKMVSLDNSTDTSANQIQYKIQTLKENLEQFKMEEQLLRICPSPSEKKYLLYREGYLTDVAIVDIYGNCFLLPFALEDMEYLSDVCWIEDKDSIILNVDDLAWLRRKQIVYCYSSKYGFMMCESGWKEIP